MKNKKYFSWVILAVGAIAFLLSSGKWNVPVMAWIWPFCMLFFARETKKVSGLLISCAVMIVLSAFKWYGCAGGSTLENIGAGLALGLLPCIPLVIDYLFYPRVKGYKATLIYPLAFAVEEFIMQLTPSATVGPISATQTGNDPLIQLASLLGSYGISVFVIWFASTLMYVFENYNEKREATIKAASIYLIVFLLVFSFGGIRLAFSDFAAPNVKVALTTGPYVGDFTSGSDITLSLEENISSMQESVRTAAAGKADILLFCEEAFTVADKDEATMVEAASQAAKENNVFVLIALEIEDEDNSQNGMSDNDEYLIDNHGEVVWKYNKSHLTNFVEPGYVTKGDGIIPNETVTLPSGVTVKLASVICMDSDFPSYVRDGLDNDTELFLVPTWDWAPIRAFHTKWVELRAVENGVSLVRSCMDGVSTATDQYGRVIMHSDTAGSGFENVVFAEVPIKAVFTLYKTIGPVIDWCYVVLLLGLIAYGLVRKQSNANISKN